MAFMLGSKNSIESLRNDVQDLQWTVTEVFSRTGPLPHPSWKYPDKKAFELDIDDVLETYNYSDDEEERQVAHVALYELVIDRLVILLQAMAKFTESLFASIKESEDGFSEQSSSLGLIAKRYWGRLTHLHSVIQQIQSENRSAKRKLSEMDKSLTKLQEELKLYRYGSAASMAKAPSQLSQSPTLLDLIPPSGADLASVEKINLTKSNLKCDISSDACHKASQTFETAFKPCECCEFVQDCLRQAGDIIIGVCNIHGLPSSLNKFKTQVANLTWLTAHDVMRWSAEQNKDISRISHYMERLAADVNPLKNQVETFEKDLKESESKTKQAEIALKQEKEVLMTVQKQASARLKERETRLGEELNKAIQERDALVDTRRKMEQELEKTSRQISEQTKQLSLMETSKAALQHQLETAQLQAGMLESSKGEVENLKAQLKEVNGQLECTNKALSKEQARYRSANKHNESLQAKQLALLERIDAMDREGEELKQQVAELEDQKEQLSKTLQQVQQETKNLQLKLTNTKSEMELLVKEKAEHDKKVVHTHKRVEELEKQLEEAKEHERLLIEYPDLNGPINTDYQGTGNLAVDMENQVAANSVRIRVLEEQNTGLRNSISKVLSMKGPRTLPMDNKELLTGGPQKLWNPSVLSAAKTNNADFHADKFRNKNNNSEPKEAWMEKTAAQNTMSTKMTRPTSQNILSVHGNEFMVGPSTYSENSSKNTVTNRPLSGKLYNPDNSTSISAYKDLKKKDLLNSHSNNTSEVKMSTVDSSSQDAPQSFTCHRCDKMYTRPQDLEIHQSYCTG